MFVSLTLTEDNRGWRKKHQKQWGHFERSLIRRQFVVCHGHAATYDSWSVRKKKKLQNALCTILVLICSFLFVFVFEMGKKTSFLVFSLCCKNFCCKSCVFIDNVIGRTCAYQIENQNEKQHRLSVKEEVSTLVHQTGFAFFSSPVLHP